MDNIDKKILIELQKAGRESASNIAEKIDVSVPTITERIRKLEESGVIVGFQAVIDSSKIGFDVSAIITIISGSSHYKIFPSSLHKKIKVIQNFAQGNIFNSYKNIEKKFANHPQVRILFLSNMLPEKGYIELLHGFKLLSKKIRQVKMI